MRTVTRPRPADPCCTLLYARRQRVRSRARAVRTGCAHGVAARAVPPRCRDCGWGARVQWLRLFCSLIPQLCRNTARESELPRVRRVRMSSRGRSKPRNLRGQRFGKAHQAHHFASAAPSLLASGVFSTIIFLTERSGESRYTRRGLFPVRRVTISNTI